MCRPWVLKAVRSAAVVRWNALLTTHAAMNLWDVLAQQNKLCLKCTGADQSKASIQDSGKANNVRKNFTSGSDYSPRHISFSFSTFPQFMWTHFVITAILTTHNPEQHGNIKSIDFVYFSWERQCVATTIQTTLYSLTPPLGPGFATAHSPLPHTLPCPASTHAARWHATLQYRTRLQPPHNRVGSAVSLTPARLVQPRLQHPGSSRPWKFLIAYICHAQPSKRTSAFSLPQLLGISLFNTRSSATLTSWASFLNVSAQGR